jgi:hypothetical protein
VAEEAVHLMVDEKQREGERERERRERRERESERASQDPIDTI